MSEDHPFLEQHRVRYEQGDKSQILYCLNWCMFNRVPIPDWLEQAFLAAYAAVTTYQVKSWDDVFGRYLPKHKRLKKERRNLDMNLSISICNRIHERHKAGAKITKSLFDDVGKEFEIGGTLASELYYAFLKEFD